MHLININQLLQAHSSAAGQVNSFSLSIANRYELQQNSLQLLVAGAGGQLGKRVVQILHTQGYKNLIAASRNPAKLHELSNLGIEVRKADFNDPDGLSIAFKNIDRLFLISTDELQTPGLRIKQHLNAIAAAKAAGIKHIVYTSMPNPATSQDIPFAPDHVATEQALIESGMGYTILRVSWYAENLVAYLPQIIRAGSWPTVAGGGKIAFVPREDVARAAVAALLNESDNRVLDITGSAALSVREIAAEVSEVFGKTITVINLPDDQIEIGLKKTGIPDAFIPTVVMTDLNTRAGQFNVKTDTVEQLTGTAPQTLREFLKENATWFLTDTNNTKNKS